MAYNSSSFKELCEKIRSLIDVCMTSLQEDKIGLQFQHDLKSVQRTARGFTKIVHHAMTDVKDQETRGAIEKACEKVENHIHALLSSTQKVRASRIGKELQGKVVFHFDAILHSLKDVVFLMNESEIQRICDIAQAVLDRLSMMEQVRSPDDLASNLKEFLKYIVEFSDQVVWKFQVLSEGDLLSRVSEVLRKMKQLIEMFSSYSMESFQDEDNAEAKIWKSYTFSEITRSIKEILGMVYSHAHCFREYATSTGVLRAVQEPCNNNHCASLRPLQKKPEILLSNTKRKEEGEDNMKRTVIKYVHDFNVAAQQIEDENCRVANEEVTLASRNLLDEMKSIRVDINHPEDRKESVLSSVLLAHAKEDYSLVESKLNDVSRYICALRGIVISMTGANSGHKIQESNIDNKFLELKEINAQLFSLARTYDGHKSKHSKQLSEVISSWDQCRRELIEQLWTRLNPWIVIASEYRERWRRVMNRELLTEKVLTYHNCIRRLKYLAHSLGKYPHLNLEDSGWESTKRRQRKLENDLETIENAEAKWICGIMSKERDVTHIHPELGLLKWACSCRRIYEICSKSLEGRYFEQWTEKDLPKQMNALMEMCNELLDLTLPADAKETLQNLASDFKIIYQRLGLHRQSTADRELDDRLLPLEAASKRLELGEVIDQLAKETEAPMKHLLEKLRKTPLSPSSSSARHVEESLEVLRRKVENVEIHSALAVQNAYGRKEIHQVFTTIDYIKRLTDAIADTVGNHPAAEIEYSKLAWYCRYWKMKAFILVNLLRKISDVRMDSVTAVMRHLLSGKDMSSPFDIDVLSSSQVSVMANLRQLDLESCSFFDGMGSILELPTLPDIRFEDNTTTDEGVFTAEKEDQDSTLSLQGSDITFIAPRSSPRIAGTRITVNGGDFVHRKSLPRSPSPLPLSNKESIEENILTEGIQGAAFALKRAVEADSSLDNSVVVVVTQMADQMFQMAEFARGRGSLRSREDFIKTAKAIALNAEVIRNYALDLAKKCKPCMCRNDLLHHSGVLPTISAQLQVISSVKAASPEDESADIVLVTNADNLMRAIVGTLKAIQAASIELRL